MENKSKMGKKEFSLPQTSAAALMGKQSVRATFRLSVECINAISILSAQMGIKQKSLFDHLMEDANSLVAIAHEVESGMLNKEGRTQKTFVISRKSLSLLDTISKQFNFSRDDLVEVSVRRLLPIIAKERQKQVKRERLSLKIAEHLEEGIGLLDEIKRQLGNEDLIFKSMTAVIETYNKAYSTIGSFIEKGKRIEDFPFEKFIQK
jgi:hypothetical protein